MKGKKATPEMIKELGHGQAQRMIETAVNKGDKIQVENQVEMLVEMAVTILGWSVFNKAVHTERFSQTALVEIQALNDRIQDEVDSMKRQLDNGELFFKENVE